MPFEILSVSLRRAASCAEPIVSAVPAVPCSVGRRGTLSSAGPASFSTSSCAWEADGPGPCPCGVLHFQGFRIFRSPFQFHDPAMQRPDLSQEQNSQFKFNHSQTRIKPSLGWFPVPVGVIPRKIMEMWVDLLYLILDTLHPQVPCNKVKFV